jgi:indolepyruvate decarboxylase
MNLVRNGNIPDYGSPEEARKMLARAVAELHSDQAHALEQFNDPNGPFRDRDLYVFCFDITSGKMTAAYDSSLLGTDIRALRDASGVPLGCNIFYAAKEGEISTVAFNWPRPGSSKAVPKEAYITRVKDQGAGVGYYLNAFTVASYLALRLFELGVEHLFNVPGSYCGGLMRALTTFTRVRPVFTTYELEAAYAADAYARIKGFGAFCGTYGVGGLSSVNGVAGAFVERCPVIAINGGPSSQQLQNEIDYGILFLHSTGRFRTDCEIYKRVTVATEIVESALQAPAQIDAVLLACMAQRRPVYLEIGQDLWDQPCSAPSGPLQSALKESNKDALSECLDETVRRLREAKFPILWGGEEIDRWGLQDQFHSLVKRSGLKYVTTLPGKSLLSETTDGFAGVYDGRFARREVQDFVSQADLVIALGTTITDFIGDIVTRDYELMILAAGGGVRVSFHTYLNIQLADFINGLTDRLDQSDFVSGSSKSVAPYRAREFQRSKDDSVLSGTAAKLNDKEPITFDGFFARMEIFVKGKLAIADTCLALFAAADLEITTRSSFLSQAIWMSIGYSLGAAVGVAFATPKRPVVFVGDAGFREGPQVLSTLVQYELPAIVCVMSNAFLGIQQFLTGPGFYTGSQPPDYFNHIPRWDYAALAKAFGTKFLRVTTLSELETALTEAEGLVSEPYLIEVVLDEKDLPFSVADALPQQLPPSVREDFEYPLPSRSKLP